MTLTVEEKKLQKLYDDYIAKLIDLQNVLPLIRDRVNEKYAKKYKNELENNIEHIIDLFYEDYEPKSGYDRKGDLYNTYEIIAEPRKWGVRYGSEYMHFSHHQSNEFIYENSFVNGYHGGSWGVNRPQPGMTYYDASDDDIAAVPYFRGPAPYFTNWTSAAPRYWDSPFEQVDELVDSTRATLSLEATDEFNKLLKPYCEQVDKALKKLGR